MKKILVIIAILVIVVAASIFTKDMIARTVVSTGVKAITGLNLSIESMDVGIFKTSIGIKGLRLFNPSGFVDKLMADIPEIYVDYDLGALIKKRLHLETLRLNLKELVVIKNLNGELNLNSLQVIKEEKKEVAPSDMEKTEMPQPQIDVLELKIGRVIYKDYSEGTPPKVKVFNVNIDQRFENITDLYALARLIVVKALINTTLPSLANLDLGSLKEEITETLKKKATQTGVDTAKELINTATDAIRKILPFGN
ncbi:MAG: hypothetical protein ISS44_02420 [Candidatus Omnitrophica bacterium]|nr:hypothetical protein [Candidatus Omnitrophota bacterium]